MKRSSEVHFSHSIRATTLLTCILLVLLLSSCLEPPVEKITRLQIEVPKEVEFVVIDRDTMEVSNQLVEDTIQGRNHAYHYLQLNTWKWPRLVYFTGQDTLLFDFTAPNSAAQDDRLNTFLLQTDSLLIPYSLTWNMEEDVFRQALIEELTENLRRIETYFEGSSVPQFITEEVKDIERFKVAHRVANFISFKERKGVEINTDIYAFLTGVNLNNERLQKQVNNRNFQYYYWLAKVNDDLPPADYPFAVMDTVLANSKLQGIQKMIISSVVKNAFYDDEVDHTRLMARYEEAFGALTGEDPLRKRYEQIQQLKPGNPAPSIGQLISVEGDTLTLDSFKGKKVLITVWGTWCPYCKEELPYLKELIAKESVELTSVSISFDKDTLVWENYIENNNWYGIHLLDAERKSEFKENYLINGTNAYFLIDENGIIQSERGVKLSSGDFQRLLGEL